MSKLDDAAVSIAESLGIADQNAVRDALEKALPHLVMLNSEGIRTSGCAKKGHLGGYRSEDQGKECFSCRMDRRKEECDHSKHSTIGEHNGWGTVHFHCSACRAYLPELTETSDL